jgi:hypothetical protein
VVLASQVSTTSKPKWRLSQLENFYCSARRAAGFLQDSSGIFRSQFRIRSSFSSQRLSRIFLVTVSPSPSHTTSWRHQPGRARPGRKRAPTQNFSRKPGRSPSTHTQGPTEPRIDYQVPETRSDQSCATSHPARCRNRAKPALYIPGRK